MGNCWVNFITLGYNIKSTSMKVNIVFFLKEVRPEMELFRDNPLRCVKVKSLNAISKYKPNARLTFYLIFSYL